MSRFVIAAAQVPSVRGDLTANLAAHAAAVAAAGRRGVSVLVFPELSLSGYEPDLAAELALSATDDRLAPLAGLARRHRMHVIVGAPLALGAGKPALGAVLFGPDGPPRTYAKMHLGGDEPAYFTPGRTPLAFAAGGQTVGLAICADTGAASHPREYAARGATVYAAGVFLNAEWYATDAPRLAGYASGLGMLVVMANHAASMGTHRSVGRSAVWAPDGTRLAEAAGTESALVVASWDHGPWAGEVIGL